VAEGVLSDEETKELRRLIDEHEDKG